MLRIFLAIAIISSFLKSHCNIIFESPHHIVETELNKAGGNSVDDFIDFKSTARLLEPIGLGADPDQVYWFA